MTGGLSPYSAKFHMRMALMNGTVTGTVRSTGRVSLHDTTRASSRKRPRVLLKGITGPVPPKGGYR